MAGLFCRKAVLLLRTRRRVFARSHKTKYRRCQDYSADIEGSQSVMGGQVGKLVSWAKERRKVWLA